MRAASVLAVLALSTCAGIGMGAAPQVRIDDVKAIGIISAFGDDFTVKTIGPTILHNDEKTIPVAAWGIDDGVVRKVKARLSRRFDVRPLTYKRAAFAARRIRVPRGDFFGTNPIAELVRSEVSPQGLDAYLVVTSTASTVGNVGQTTGGIGIIARNDGVFGGVNEVHALYALRLFDGRQLELMAEAMAPRSGDAGPLFLNGPSRVVDGSYVPTAGDAAGNDRLRLAVNDLIDASLPAMLQQLRLIP
jgi:hypothetical protein